jgi:Hemerythrin HHE cation binding domain
MAFSHNAILRGINCIYLQAPNVKKSEDIEDLLFLTRLWTKWLMDHHKIEEDRIFPGFEKVVGKPGLLNANVEQHHVFSGGLEDLLAYATSTLPKDYSGERLRAIINSFSEPLCTHLHEEIDTLLNLRSYDGPALLKVWKENNRPKSKELPVVSTILPSFLGRLLTRFAVIQTELLPLFLGLCDKTFQGGNNWPYDMPRIVPHIANWVFVWNHRSVWRLLPCDIYGKPRPLPFA